MSNIAVKITTSPAPAQEPPVLYKGQDNTITLELINNTGKTISVKKGASITIQFTPNGFLSDSLASMSIQQDGWGQPVIDKDYNTLTLKSTATALSWAAGKPLSFDITKVNSKSDATGSGLTIYLQEFGAGIDDNYNKALSLLSAPKNINQLKEALIPELLNDGVVFVTHTGTNTPLVNSLLLNIKNITSGNLFQGETLPNQRDGNVVGHPQIIVSFAYGNTDGALCPVGTEEETGSAWQINGELTDSQGNTWTVSRNKPTEIPVGKNKGSTPPQWTLTPAKNNIPLLGSGEHANIIIEFSNIISFGSNLLTDTTSTTMYLQFKNFPKTKDTWYDDFSTALNITKKPPPPESGVIAFSATEASSTISMKKWGDPVTAIFNWIVFETPRVTLESESKGIPSINRTYKTSTPIHYGKNEAVNLSDYTNLTSVIKRGNNGKETITFNLWAKGGAGPQANNKNWQITIHYPVVEVQFDRIGQADDLDPEIRITLTPKSFVDTSTGRGAATLTFKGSRIPNEQPITKQITLTEGDSTWYYKGKFSAVFDRYLEVGTNTITLAVQQTDGRDPVTVTKTWTTDLPEIAVDFELFTGSSLPDNPLLRKAAVATDWETANPLIYIKFTSKYNLVERATLSTKNISIPIRPVGKTYAINEEFNSLFKRFLDVGRNDIVLTIHRKDGFPPVFVTKTLKGNLIDTRGGNPETYQVSFLAGSPLLWMMENLRYKMNSISSPYKYFNNGRLYQWKIANDTAPTGWRLPTKEEWDTMIKNNAKGNNPEDFLGFQENPGFYDSNKNLMSAIARYWSSSKNEDNQLSYAVTRSWGSFNGKYVDPKEWVSVRYVLDTYNPRIMQLFPKDMGWEYGDWPTSSQLGINLSQKDQTTTTGAVFNYYNNRGYWAFPTWQLSGDDQMGVLKIHQSNLQATLLKVPTEDLINSYRKAYKLSANDLVDLNTFSLLNTCVATYFQQYEPNYIGFPTGRKDRLGTYELIAFSANVGIMGRYCYDPLLEAAYRLAYQLPPEAEVNLTDPYIAGTVMSVWAQQFEKDYYGGVPTWQSGGQGAVRIPMSQEEYDFLQGKEAEWEKNNPGKVDVSKFQEALNRLRIEVS